MAKSTIFSTRQPGGMFSVQDVLQCPGEVYYVGSAITGAADSEGYGQNPDAPYKTIDYAIGQCKDDRGDLIIVLPKHAETVAAAGGLDIDVKGITIAGLGKNSQMPTITLGTATTADVDINATDVTLKNLKFVSDIDDLAVILDVNEDNLVVEDCQFESSSTKECINFINLATTKDNYRFARCRFIQPTDPEGTDAAANTGCFYFVDTEYIFVEDCLFYGHFETAIFHNRTTAAKNLWIRNCYGTQLLTGAEIWTQVANMHGGCDGCLFITPGADDATEAKICGTISAKFFVGVNNGFGNDGDGGQLAIAGASAAT